MSNEANVNALTHTMPSDLVSDNGRRRVQACQVGSGSHTTGAVLAVCTGSPISRSGHQAT